MITIPSHLRNSTAILWDMDGVLVDTGRLHYESWAQVLRGYGLDLTLPQFVRTSGMNNRSTLQTLFGRDPREDELEKIAGEKEDLFRAMLPGRVHLLPGVRRWLETFSAWGLPQAIASSAPPANIDALVNALEIRGFFAALVSGMDIPGKPNPDVFLLAARQLGVAPANVLVIEDSVPGVSAARRAGMLCLAVETTHPASALADAHCILPNLDALDEALVLSLLNHQQAQ